MKRALLALAALVGVVLIVGAAFLYRQVTTLRWEQVQGDVYVIFGLGGNVGVLKTNDGAVVVDTMTFPIQGERIRQIRQTSCVLAQRPSSCVM